MDVNRKIVLFGATGYTGHLLAEEMVSKGLSPILCGRNEIRLKDMAGRLGGLDYSVADVDDPDAFTFILGKGDVLVSTVGPFLKYGQTAIRAAIDKSAVYIDSTGEPAFIRKVFDEYGPLAKNMGASLITACGYDYIPGNCAAGLALDAAGPKAKRVDVGYFSTSGGRISPLDMSQGTKKSLIMSLVTPIKVFSSGAYAMKTGGTKVRRFDLDGIDSLGLSISCTEQFSLPRVYPHLSDVCTYLGWFGKMTRVMQAGAMIQTVMGKIPGYIPLASFVLSRLPESKGRGPKAMLRQKHATHVIAEAFDENGALLNRTDLVGADAYTFTARFMAWAAETASKNGSMKPGALGPIEAFGLDKLKVGCDQSGLTAVTSP